MDPVKVSIIIVSWNSASYLKKCIESIELHIKDICYEIIVVDNCSSDHLKAMMKNNFSQLLLIEETFNKGFSGACNDGLKEAKGEFVLFLNPDTLLKKGSLDHLLKKIESDSNIGFVGPKVLSEDGSFQRNSRRLIPNVESVIYSLFGLSKFFPKHPRFSKYNLGGLPEDQECKVDAVSSTCMFVRRSVLESGFDERFFLYVEDLDLCARIGKAGLDGYYCPESEIIHFGGQSCRKSPFKSIYHFYYSAYLFHEKYYAEKTHFLLNELVFLGLGLRGIIAIVWKAILVGLPMLIDKVKRMIK